MTSSFDKNNLGEESFALGKEIHRDKRIKFWRDVLVKPTVVANTRAWSFIVEILQRKIVVISWVVYPKFNMI